MSDTRPTVGATASFSTIYQALRPTTVVDGLERVQLNEHQQLYSALDWFPTAGMEAWQERGTRMEYAAAYIRESIDREYGPGVGDTVFLQLHHANQQNLRSEVTRSDLDKINAKVTALAKRWNDVTSATIKDTTERIDRLVRQSPELGESLRNEFNNLKSESMQGLRLHIDVDWATLRSRVDDAERKSARARQARGSGKPPPMRAIRISGGGLRRWPVRGRRKAGRC